MTLTMKPATSVSCADDLGGTQPGLPQGWRFNAQGVRARWVQRGNAQDHRGSAK